MVNFFNIISRKRSIATVTQIIYAAINALNDFLSPLSKGKNVPKAWDYFDVGMESNICVIVPRHLVKLAPVKRVLNRPITVFVGRYRQQYQHWYRLLLSFKNAVPIRIEAFSSLDNLPNSLHKGQESTDGMICLKSLPTLLDKLDKWNS